MRSASAFDVWAPKGRVTSRKTATAKQVTRHLRMKTCFTPTREKVPAMTIYVLGGMPGKFKLFIVSIRIGNRKPVFGRWSLVCR